MKQIIALITIISLLGFQQQKSTQINNTKFSIVGKVDKVPDGTIFYLVKNGGKDTLQNTKIWNGIFKFEGHLEKEGELHFVKMDTSHLNLGKNRISYVRLLLENKDITINGSLNTWPNVEIKGSYSTQEFETLLKIVKEARNSSLKKLETIDQDTSLERKIRNVLIEDEKKLHFQNLFDFFIKNNDSYATPFLIINYAPDSVDYLEKIISLLDTKVKNGYYAQKLINKIIPEITQRNNLGVGKIMPEFTLTTVDKKEIFLKSIIKNNKLTLIDFWASWCKPCRSQFPHLLKIYQKYSQLGFNIVGLSQDKDGSAWDTALIKEKLPWTNLWDQNNKVGNLFGLSAIPAYALVDQNGSIIAFSGFGKVGAFGPSLMGENLEATLNKLLGSSNN